jgi:hypothetical protein
MPPDVGQRIAQTIAGERSQGATRLRGDGHGRKSRGRAFWSGLAVAAATLIAVFVIVPMMKAPTTVSASEILAASADRLARESTKGVELLEYELTVDGMPAGMIPDHTNGTYRVSQAIDHARRGHYRFATYLQDGTLLSALAQDPANGRRVMLVRLDDQSYRFNFTIPEDASMSVPEMERLHMQASVAMMQASGNQLLQVVDGPSGRQYRIDVPRVRASAEGAVWDLTEARVVVAADDYRIIQFAVKGTLLKQPYSVSYRLLNREVREQTQLAGDEFDVPNEPGAVTLDGDGSAVPAGDALVVALRELAKVKQRR